MSRETQQWQPSHEAGAAETFGRYRLRGVIGRGGMGVLYVAEQLGIEGFRKIVALKRILPHLADSQHFRAMFLNEARVAARLDHPNIVATYELGEVDGTYFISMEYLPGEDLATVLARCRALQPEQPMPLEIAAALAQQCANGLHYAHEMTDANGNPVHLTHRDVNPLNIFVTYHGMTKLLDFGIVKNVSDGARTAPGAFKGKYAYCAPEQLAGGTIDRQTDLFCLGIVLWESLTGRPLFLRDSDVATIDAIRGERIEPPSAYRKDVPPELDQIVMHALSRDRRSRIQNAHLFSEALERFLRKREHRPSPKSIGLWLETIFGGQRAMLKKAIAQGSEVEAALTQLPSLEERRPVTTEGSAPPLPASLSTAQPRMIWSSKVGSAPGIDGLRAATAAAPFSSNVARPAPVLPEAAAAAATDHAPAARPAPQRSRAPLFIGVVVAVAAAGTALAMLSRKGTDAAAPAAVATAAAGSIELRSAPPGAQVFVDGDPSGLSTPATLTGLRPGRAVEIRLDKVGYAPVTERIEVKQGQAVVRAFTLEEAVGTVILEGLPSGVTIYANDTLVETLGPLTLPIGKQRIRVETSKGIYFSQTLDVRAGTQTVSVARAK